MTEFWGRTTIAIGVRVGSGENQQERYMIFLLWVFSKLGPVSIQPLRLLSL